MKPTQYRPIVFFPGYRIGDDGSPWSDFHPSRPLSHQGQWRRLAVRPDKNGGHLRVNLYRVVDGRRKLFVRLVHILVLEAFVGRRPPGMVCRHFPDRDPTNNSVENLQWGTRAENLADMVIHGTSLRGAKNGRAKLDEASVTRIRQLLRDGHSQEAVGYMFGVVQATISRLNCGVSWADC